MGAAQANVKSAIRLVIAFALAAALTSAVTLALLHVNSGGGDPLVAPPPPENLVIPTNPDSLPEPLALKSRPLWISIPALNVDSDVVPVGMNPDQSMEIPADIYDIGWYEPGVAPGSETGSAVFAGHRDGAEQGKGAFYNLSQLSAGDDISVMTNSGLMTFEVTAIELLDKQTFAERSQEIFATDGPGVLTLITCGGSYDRSRGGYQANVIVTATKTPSEPNLTGTTL